MSPLRRGLRSPDAAAQTIAWEELKRRERAEGTRPGVLADVPLALPALTRAAKLGKRAAQVGFEWPDILGALDKVREEIDELRHEISSGGDAQSIEHEVGDVLFRRGQLVNWQTGQLARVRGSSDSGQLTS